MGSWALYPGGGPHNNTLHYTFESGDMASFTFSGTQFVLRYTQDTHPGNYDEYVDGTAVAIN